MLNQSGLEFISYILNYLPTILTITFNIIILVFAILIFKKNSYKYGITLMMSSIISLAYSILFMSIQYPDLIYLLYFDLNLPMSIVNMILITWSFVFLGLNTLSTILLVVSISQIYKSHKKVRID